MPPLNTRGDVAGPATIGFQATYASIRFPVPNHEEAVRVTDQAQQFASDNYAGICPEAWNAMAEANSGSATAYGDDDWTQRASDAFRTLFGTEC